MTHQGVNTGTIVYSPTRKRRADAARRREDKRWAEKSGPVTVTRIGEPSAPPEADAGQARSARDGVPSTAPAPRRTGGPERS